jgi:glucosamine--fructose-6-phosphate aminotransferase (isomerizing)
LACGIAGMLELHRPSGAAAPSTTVATVTTPDVCDAIAALRAALPRGVADLTALDGPTGPLTQLEQALASLREGAPFTRLVRDAAARLAVEQAAAEFTALTAECRQWVESSAETLASAALEASNRVLIRMADAAWALERDVLALVQAVLALAGAPIPSERRAIELHRIAATLDALDRLEIRGRDSLGLSLIATVSAATWPALRRAWGDVVGEGVLRARVARRFAADELLLREPHGEQPGTVVLGWRVAAEIGKLGDNVRALRTAITADPLLPILLEHDGVSVTAMAHTRWASNGIINLANCHPVDNRSLNAEGVVGTAARGTIHVTLNGDIDNYEALRQQYEQATGRRIEPEVTTDAKIIALAIERELETAGGDLDEAFRRAVSAFEGSAAIAMHSDLAPGRIYLSLKGSGQALYVGLLAGGGYVFASEVYGLVALTDRYIALDGETPRDPAQPSSVGQWVVLDARGRGGLAGIVLRSHDGVVLSNDLLKLRKAQITTRDIDRGHFDHFFRKEIDQAPQSIASTLRGKFLLREGQVTFNLGEEILPARLVTALCEGRLRRIICCGQGTAAVAAAAIASVASDVLRGSGLAIEAMRASELSGFALRPSMEHVLVIAVSQSGTTTDTNRAIEMARERGAATLAIVNRRDSAITEKVDGVYYTADGRDVEMSVASTKAFYSQVAAGTVLALRLAQATAALQPAHLARRLAELRRLPELLREVLALEPQLAAMAAEHAPCHRHWAVVGSGPDHVAAAEVRIKLSELCYKSIACDVIEDKKHIDLSSEPLILVLAAGSPDGVLGDLVKDVAIFKAHKAAPIVFASEEADRFAPYAAACCVLPHAGVLESLVLNTMAGHLFGYHAACALDRSAAPLIRARQAVVHLLDSSGDPWDILTDEALRAQLSAVETEVANELVAHRYDAALDPATAVELILALGKALRRGEPAEVAVDHLLRALTHAIEALSRPIDAIKHQAKTVTVGTSRREELPAGPLFAAAVELGLRRDAFHGADVAELKRLQPAVAAVPGALRYIVSGLPISGIPDASTSIRPLARSGLAAQVPSRTEGGALLQGTKRMIVRTRQVYLGVGGSDGRRILIVPTYDKREQVDGLLLCHLDFVPSLVRADKIRVLGMRYEDIKHAVIEANLAWDDTLLDALSPEDLCVLPDGELAERLASIAALEHAAKS